MILPNYLHVGQPKAGSTTIHFALRQHPDVCLPWNKEAHYFDFEYEFGHEYYFAKHFSHWSGQSVVGDVTPNYWQEICLERIANLMPHARISACIRFPVARSFSHYCHGIRIFEEGASFDNGMRRGDAYRKNSRASSVLKKLFELFPREQVEVLIFERDIASPKTDETVQRLLKFLGLRTMKLPTEKGNSGFLPALTFVERESSLLDHRGKKLEVQRGDVIVETLADAQHFHTVIERQPSEERLSLLRAVSENVTPSVSAAQVKDYYDEFFAEDVESVRELLKDPLPEWTAACSKALTAPKRLQSRLKAQS